MNDLTLDPYAEFADDLLPGEKILWAGQPSDRLTLQASDGCLVPFSLLWGGFAFFWEFVALNAWLQDPSGGSIVMPIFGLPFVAIGAYLIFGRFWVDRWIRRYTFYAVTDRRALWLTKMRSRVVQSVAIDSSLVFTKQSRPDGSGSIVFGEVPSMLAGTANFPGALGRSSSALRTPTFQLIDNVNEVASILESRRGAAQAETR